MSPSTRILASLFAFALFPGGYSAFTSVHSRRSTGTAKVVGGCRQNFGWPGHNFPADPWGVVMGDGTESTSPIGDISGPGDGVAGVAESPSTEPLASPTAIPFPTLSYSAIVETSTPTSSIPFNATSSLAVPTSSIKISSTSISSKSTPTSTKEATSSSAPAPPAPSSEDPPPKATTTTIKHTTQTQPAQTSSEPKPAPSPLQALSGGAGGQGSGATSGPTSNADIQAYLAAHNSIRAQHGAAPLTYSQDLATKAQSWANRCVFKHSGGSLGPLGENLAAGTGGGYAIPQAIKSWTDEVSQYNSGNPQPSHFTQVVWKGTTQVGCALQNCDGIFSSSFGKAHFYVCEYSPAGNVIGSFAANVQV